MAELRINPVTGRGVVIAPQRADRPHRPRSPGPAQAADAASCPFCPGNEDQLPDILFALPSPRPPLWRTRAVPNRFPILTPGPGTPAGRHEVIIESPRHDADLADMPAAQAEAVVETWVARAAAAMEDRRVRSLFIFRNRGPFGGASLAHPHSQLIAPDFVPPELRERERRAAAGLRRDGRTPLASLVADELAERRRLVFETGSYLAFVPHAAEVPFDTWLVPKVQDRPFHALAAEARNGLAHALQRLLRRLAARLDDPAYNMMILTPSRAGSRRGLNEWFIRIRPRLSTPAGFELASGLAVNVSLPECDAALLRRAPRKQRAAPARGRASRH